MTKQNNIKAILLGFGDFEDKTIQNIPNVNVNLELLRHTFENLIQVPTKNIFTISNLSTSDDTINQVGEIIDGLSKDDVLLFYFAGHGFLSDKGGFDLYWAHSKSVRSTIHRNGIKAKEVMAEINAAKPKNKIVILDCCHAGKSLVGIQSSPADAINGRLETVFTNTEGLFAISAVDEYEVATFEIETPDKPTHFTAAFIDVLKRDKLQTLEDLYNATYQLLAEQKRHLPQKIAKNTIGNFSFFSNLQVQPENQYHTHVEEDKEDSFTPLPKPKELYSVSPERRNLAKLFLNSALTMRSKERYEECLAYLDKALEQNPFDPEIHLSLGITKGFVIANDLHGAIEHFEKVIELAPNHPKALSNLGILQYNLGQYIEAEKTLEAAKYADPNNAGIWTNLGLTKAVLKHKDAEECLKKSITLNPDYSAAYNNLGNLYKDQKQFKRATFYYKKALNLTPDSYDAWNNLGLTYLEWNEFDNLEKGEREANDVNSTNIYDYALSALAQALRINTLDYRAYTNIIKAFLDAKDEEGSEIVMNVVEGLEEAINLKHVSNPKSEYDSYDLLSYINQNYNNTLDKIIVSIIDLAFLEGQEVFPFESDKLPLILEDERKRFLNRYVYGDEEIVFTIGRNNQKNYSEANQKMNFTHFSPIKVGKNGYVVFISPNISKSPLKDIALIVVDNITKPIADRMVLEIENYFNSTGFSNPSFVTEKERSKIEERRHRNVIRIIQDFQKLIK